MRFFMFCEIFTYIYSIRKYIIWTFAVRKTRKQKIHRYTGCPTSYNRVKNAPTPCKHQHVIAYARLKLLRVCSTVFHRSFHIFQYISIDLVSLTNTCNVFHHIFSLSNSVWWNAAQIPLLKVISDLLDHRFSNINFPIDSTRSSWASEEDENPNSFTTGKTPSFK